MIDRVERGHESEVRYRQFEPDGPLAQHTRTWTRLLLPIVWPLAWLARRSDILFITLSEALAMIPYLPGVLVRGAFYRLALSGCGDNVVIEFGTIFLVRDVRIGSDVLIGRRNVVHHCDIGDFVLTGENCTFLSGSRYHRFDDPDRPIARQGGTKTRIALEGDCWIGAGAIVMADVGRGAVVGAGSVVTRAVEPQTIVAGNPARVVRKRGDGSGAGADAAS